MIYRAKVLDSRQYHDYAVHLRYIAAFERNMPNSEEASIPSLPVFEDSFVS
jgi:hypothetical protein